MRILIETHYLYRYKRNWTLFLPCLLASFAQSVGPFVQQMFTERQLAAGPALPCISKEGANQGSKKRDR